mgnify:CR=1
WLRKPYFNNWSCFNSNFCITECWVEVTTNTINKKSVYLNLLSYLKSLLQLMKPRVMSLVIFTCAVGLLTS